MTVPLKRADIILIHRTHPLSVGIQLLTNSPYSHAVLVSNPETGEIIEAEPFSGVTYGELKEYQGHGLVLRLESLTDEQSDSIIKFAEDQVGSPYDFGEVLQLFNRYQRKLPPDADQDKAFICSTLIAAAYQSIGIQLSDQIVQSPDDLFKSPHLSIIGRF
ncbi:YiiX/YebB-like N1pC/P60 family cysteine hydrolase [Ammoniphilus sp. 3BR4]|uniref:YiiX/YebB-like N1pC/P60 family cysteine hydrolase n=1 Tax=Ammoniphilus sp. 3BR4 TaxID=3158265 RepID=UPI0034673749